jgi:hypothetical protein
MLHLRQADLEWRVVEGETVLLDFRRGGRYLAMNASATVLLPLLSAGTTPTAMVARMIEAYGLTRAQAVTDVDAFLVALQEVDLLVQDVVG